MVEILAKRIALGKDASGSAQKLMAYMWGLTSILVGFQTSWNGYRQGIHAVTAESTTSTVWPVGLSSTRTAGPSVVSPASSNLGRVSLSG